MPNYHHYKGTIYLCRVRVSFAVCRMLLAGTWIYCYVSFVLFVFVC